MLLFLIHKLTSLQSQSKRINWTVEWIHEDHTSSIGFLFDDEQVCKGYRPLYLKRTGTTRRKRKLNEEPPASLGTSNTVQDIETLDSENLVSAKEHFESSSLKRYHEDAIGRELLITPTNDNPATAATVSPLASTTKSDQVDGIIEGEPVREDVVKDKPGQQQPVALPIGASDDLNLYYYLVKPRTSGTKRVLIPLSPSDTFLTCLQNQTIIEYPSIQVLPSSPVALPVGFVTEEQYLTRYKKEAHEMEQLIKEEGEIDSDADLKADDRDAPLPYAINDTDTVAMPNPSTILATLERDIRR